MSDLTEFDYATKRFTEHMDAARNWKHGYFGAAYTTRLRQAIKQARDACDVMEAAIIEDEKPR